MKNAFYTCSLALLSLLAGCKKEDSNSAAVSYEQMGETRVNGLTGFAFNGDPLAVTSAGENIRWRVAAKQWERVGAGATLPKESRITLTGEDAGGTYYGSSLANNGSVVAQGLFELPAGGTVWQPLKFPDGDSVAYSNASDLFVNGPGDVVVLTKKVFSTGARSSVYHRAAGTPTWVRINDRPADDLYLLQFTDGGDVFLQGQVQGKITPSLFVLQKNGGALKPVFDCNATTILPYCSFYANIAPNGEILLFEGGIGSRKIYRANAAATYPTTATEAFSFSTELPVPRGCRPLGNGTVLTEGNDGGYGSEQFFIRRSGATEWQHLPELPGFGYVSVSANRQGQLFTSSRQSAGGDGNVYHVKY